MLRAPWAHCMLPICKYGMLPCKRWSLVGGPLRRLWTAARRIVFGLVQHAALFAFLRFLPGGIRPPPVSRTFAARACGRLGTCRRNRRSGHWKTCAQRPVPSAGTCHHRGFLCTRRKASLKDRVRVVGSHRVWSSHLLGFLVCTLKDNAAISSAHGRSPSAWLCFKWRVLVRAWQCNGRSFLLLFSSDATLLGRGQRRRWGQKTRSGAAYVSLHGTSSTGATLSTVCLQDRLLNG